MSNKIFGDRVKKLRTDKKMTMEALANDLDISKSRINMWENNGVVPREDILLKISHYFDVSTDYLLGNDNMEGKEPGGSTTLHFLQRNLKGMNDEQLEKAKNVLISVFDEIFNDDEE